MRHSEAESCPRIAYGTLLLVIMTVVLAGCGGEPVGPTDGDRSGTGGAPLASLAAVSPLGVYAPNPRYYAVAGQPVLLLGGGPVVVPGETAAIDETVSNGGNHVRLWHTVPGSALPMPWVQGSDGRWDLLQYEAAFWSAMRTTLAYARDRGVFVQVFLFSEPQLERAPDRWDLHPYNPTLNVNGLGLPGVGQQGTPAFFTLTNPPLRAVQESYVRKFMAELGGYENLIVELVNEYERGPNDWESHFLGVADTLTGAPLAVNRLRAGTVGVPFGDARVQQVSWHNLPADTVFVRFRRYWSHGKVQVYDEQSIGNQTAAAIRLMAWGAVLGGGHISWNGSGNSSAARQTSRGVAAFFRGTALVPADFGPDSLAGVVPVATRGREELLAWVAGASLQLDLSGWSGTYTARWYDPVAQSFSPAPDVQGGAPVTLAPPAPERLLHLVGRGAVSPPAVTIGTSGVTDGAVLTAATDVRALVTSNRPVTQVQFLVDGTLQRTDTAAPYAIREDGAGTPVAYDFAGYADGPHTLRVVVTADDGGTPFTAFRDVGFTLDLVADPPSGWALEVTGITEGGTVTGPTVVQAEVTGPSRASKVRFRIDGVHKTWDYTAPFSLPASAGKAVPVAYDFAGIADGPHTLTVVGFRTNAAGQSEVAVTRTIAFTLNRAGS